MRIPSLPSSIAALAIVFFVCTPGRADSILVNGDFATGTLAGWTVFTTSTGTNGAGLPDVVSFDTTGTGASNAAHFNVGQVVALDSTQQGGGLSQSVMGLTSGVYTFSADIASQDDASGAINTAAGLFSILIDGATLASVDLGPFSSPFQVLRGTLGGSANLTAGSHMFAIEITRPVLSFPPDSPDQYVDNLSLNAAAIPEPSSLILLTSGLLFIGIVWCWKRLA